jgi:hypothetical protein
VAEIVLNVLGVPGSSPGTVEEQDTKVIAPEVNTGLQATRTCPDDNAVEEFVGASSPHAALLIHYSLPPYQRIDEKNFLLITRKT